MHQPFSLLRQEATGSCPPDLGRWVPTLLPSDPWPQTQMLSRRRTSGVIWWHVCAVLPCCEPGSRAAPVQAPSAQTRSLLPRPPAPCGFELQGCAEAPLSVRHLGVWSLSCTRLMQGTHLPASVSQGPPWVAGGGLVPRGLQLLSCQQLTGFCSPHRPGSWRARRQS